ncbi:hypothetical protein RB596_003231 [Gaeumannomyces avenae]
MADPSRYTLQPPYYQPQGPENPQEPEDPAPRTQQSIALENMPRPPDFGAYDMSGYGDSNGSRMGSGMAQQQQQYGNQGYGAASAPAPAPANPPMLSTSWGNNLNVPRDDPASAHSPIDPLALQFALPPEINQRRSPSLQPEPRASSAVYAPPAMYYEEQPHHVHTDSVDSDRAPLAPNAQPISGNLATPMADGHPRTSFQTVNDADATPSRSRDTRMLGFDLEPGYSGSSSQHHSFGNSLTPEGPRSRSNSTVGALSRTASIVRAMSQRVVNISGEGELIEQQNRRSRSRSPGADQRNSSPMMATDTAYHSQLYPTSLEKQQSVPEVAEAHPANRFQEPPRRTGPMPNPLKGKSLGIFGPNNPIRTTLCDILVLPWTEPIILLLIVLQAVLLAVESAPSVFDQPRPDRFGTPIDWAILGLFIVFTFEVIARIVVSGFVLNAAEYSTIDRKRGVKVAMTQRYKQIFQPQRQKSVRRATVPEHYGPSTFARSITIMQGQMVPETIEEQQRMQLARRAFLRHGFNRLDFVAVVSFWISFLLALFGKEKELHLYVFKMLSSLRIVRLLAITKGNAIILRSLKKAAPLLVRVSFLICFFWLLFAIIGVQSFKSSFKRTCVWLDPAQPGNQSLSWNSGNQFCGGYLDPNKTGEDMSALPWDRLIDPGDLTAREQGTAKFAKGFICPRGSICLEQQNPNNGTVHFDNILNSLEMVFVIMSANTWSNLMYRTTDTDYLPATLFFIAGILIMMLWMTNLLIAVITSSFQIIREESKASAFAADQETFNPVQGDDPLKRQSTLQRIYAKTSLVWVLIIAFDLLAQAWRSARSSDARLTFINRTEVVVTILLAVEMVIRFAADWRHFHRRARNLVDLLLAVVTTVMLAPPIQESGQVYEWLTVFQILRVYRVVMAIPVTSKLIRLVLGNATGIANLMVFVFLITFLMSIFASQLFRGLLPAKAGDKDIKVTFANIYNCFQGMYQVLTSEDWTDQLYNITGATVGFGTAWMAGIFFVGWFILSYFILINMFIAVIQENFDVSEDQKRLEQVKAFLQRRELGSSSNLSFSKLFTFGRQRKRDPLDYGPAMMEMLLKEAVVKDFLDDDAIDPLQRAPTFHTPNARGPANGPIIQAGRLGTVWARVTSVFSSKDPNPFYSNVRFDGPNENLDARQMAHQAVSAATARRKAQREYLGRHPTYNNSLYIFTPKNPIRRLCQRLVGPGRGIERIDGVEPNKYAWYIFSAIVYTIIVTMVVLACITTPLYQKEYRERKDFSLRNWFVWTDLGFAAFFAAEAVIKVIADGFFFTPNAYFRSSWGAIDGVVLVTLWVNVVTLLANQGTVSRAIGAFKALRALRLLNVSDRARDTFHSLIIVQGWKIISAAFVSLSLLIPFAIYGLNLFHGRTMQCNDGDGAPLLDDCFGEYNSTPFNNDWPMLAPRVAKNPSFSFDDFGSSLFILYQIVSQEGWTDVSYAAQSVTQRGVQPKWGNRPGNGMFFIIFNLLATVFVLTLFISVFMRNYTEQTGVAFLTAEQRAWLELRKILRQISPSKTSYDESRNKFKQWCHKRAIEKRGKWYTAITVILVMHLILLLVQYYEEPDWWEMVRDYIFLFFTVIYLANVCVRVVGLGWARFRRSSWDLFSLVAVTGTLLTTIFYLADMEQEAVIQLHKSFLVAIVLLLIPRNDALDQLFKTAAASLTTIGNLLATWFVFYIMFAIAMTQAFSLTRFNTNETNNLNYRTVPKALLLLFRFSAGEAWNTIMEDYAALEAPFCVDDPNNFFLSDCGSTAWARVLFIAWNIISMYIFVNLFVSLIYESFSYVYQRSSGLDVVDRDEIRRFKEAWRSVDPQGTGFISKEAFPRLLGELSGVFEMRIYDAEDSVGQILDDVRSDKPPDNRHSSIVSQSAFTGTGIDLQRLNERLARIDVDKVRERRRRYNLFFEEIMVLADPDKGIAFGTVLMILAHYNIISDSKSLKLEEFLRRRARLQRVEEEVRRRVVQGFFDTLFWSRRFRRHMERKRSARMTNIPQLDVPEILVDNEDDLAGGATPLTPISPFPARNRAQSSFLSADDARNAMMSQHHHRSWSGVSGDVATWNQEQQYGGHPLGQPTSAGGRLGGQSISPGGWDDGSSSHRYNHSAFSFELQDPMGSGSGSGGGGGGGASGGGGGTGSQPGSGPNSRRGSAISPSQARELLDDSVWVESIRKSATVRRSDWAGRGSGGAGGSGF